MVNEENIKIYISHVLCTIMMRTAITA